MGNRFLTKKETAKILCCSEENVEEYIKKGHLKAYVIAGQIIRFKENEVLDCKTVLNIGDDKKDSLSENDYTFTEKLVDFLYFNDFYILTVLVMFLILAIIFLEVF